MKSMISLMLLVCLTLSISACKVEVPSYDRCVLIIEAGIAHCFPIKQPGVPEYQIPIDKEMTGWMAISPEDFRAITKALNEAEEQCGGN